MSPVDRSCLQCGALYSCNTSWYDTGPLWLAWSAGLRYIQQIHEDTFVFVVPSSDRLLDVPDDCSFSWLYMGFHHPGIAKKARPCRRAVRLYFCVHVEYLLRVSVTVILINTVACWSNEACGNAVTGECGFRRMLCSEQHSFANYSQDRRASRWWIIRSLVIYFINQMRRVGH